MRLGSHLTAVMLASTGLVVAHEPYESSAVARFDDEALELVVTASFEIAGLLVGQPTDDPAALETLRPKLLGAGAELYELSLGDKPIKPERFYLEYKEGEAVFSLIYPQAKPAGMRFRAAYLDKLPIGYSGSLKVVDEAGNSLGHYPRLKKGNDTLSIESPAASSVPASTHVVPPAASDSPRKLPAAPVAEPAAIQPRSITRFPFWLAGICILLLIVWILGKTRKSHP